MTTPVPAIVPTSSPFTHSASSSPDDVGVHSGIQSGIHSGTNSGANMQPSATAASAASSQANAKLANAFVDFVVVLGMTPQTGLIPAKKPGAADMTSTKELFS